MTIIKIAVYEDVYFDSEKDAKEFCAKFNARNTAASAPDWYMVANYEGRVV